MKIINPNTISRSDITNTVGTGLPNHDVAEWLVGTTYITDQFARVDDEVYQAIQGSTGQDPTTDTTNTYWIYYGVTNTLKPFDNIVSSRAKQSGNITYQIFSTDFLSGIALLDLINISTVLVTVSIITGDPPSAELIYNSGTVSLQNGVTGTYKRNYSFTDLPLYKNVTITVTLNRLSTSAPAELGEIVLGKTINLGFTEYGASTGIIDYSSKTQDDFGNYSVVPRAFSKKSSVKLKVLPGQIDYTIKTLTNFRSTPVVWVTVDNTNYTGILLIYGFYKDFTLTIPDCSLAELSLNIEGLV